MEKESTSPTVKFRSMLLEISKSVDNIWLLYDHLRLADESLTRSVFSQLLQFVARPLLL